MVGVSGKSFAAQVFPMSLLMCVANTLTAEYPEFFLEAHEHQESY